MNSLLRWKLKKNSNQCKKINLAGCRKLIRYPPYFMEAMPMKKSPVWKAAAKAIIESQKEPVIPNINFNHALKGVCEYAFK